MQAISRIVQNPLYNFIERSPNRIGIFAISILGSFRSEFGNFIKSNRVFQVGALLAIAALVIYAVRRCFRSATPRAAAGAAAVLPALPAVPVAPAGAAVVLPALPAAPVAPAGAAAVLPALPAVPVAPAGAAVVLPALPVAIQLVQASVNYGPIELDPRIDRSIPMCEIIDRHLAIAGFNPCCLFNDRTLLYQAIHSGQSSSDTVQNLVNRNVWYTTRQKDITVEQFKALIKEPGPGQAMEGLILAAENGTELMDALLPLATLQHGDSQESRMAGSIILGVNEKVRLVVRERIKDVLPDFVADKLHHTAIIVVEYLSPSLPKEVVGMIQDINKGQQRLKAAGNS